MTRSETDGLKYTLYINFVIFGSLLILFEVVRNIKQMFLKRMTLKLEKANRVPSAPPKNFLGWIHHIMQISEIEFLHMVGLDGYMLMRFIKICFKISCFFSFWGLLVLIPVYQSAGGELEGWAKFTLANVVNGIKGSQLWVPAIFSYVFSAYVCHLFYEEYKNFVQKRLEYLVQGDPDTLPQTYYTVMVENIPPSLRSAPTLRSFFEKNFKDEVFSVDLPLELSQLESLCAERKNARNNLEKAIAMLNASGQEPEIWITKSSYEKIANDLKAIDDSTPYASSSSSPTLIEGHNGQEKGVIDTNGVTSSFSESYIVPKANMCNYWLKVNAIEHYGYLLRIFNHSVRHLQLEYLARIQKLDALEVERLKLNPNSRTSIVLGYMSKGLSSAGLLSEQKAESSEDLQTGGFAIKGFRKGSFIPPKSELLTPLRIAKDDSGVKSRDNSLDGSNKERKNFLSDYSSHNGSIVEEGETHINPKGGYILKGTTHIIETGAKLIEEGTSVAIQASSGLASEGLRTAQLAGRGAIKGVLEATRTLEMLTLGAYYHVSSTAFVTLKTRVSKSIAHQMLLSHEYYELEVTSAPSTKDIIWQNVSVPLAQIKLRKNIADATLIFGALFWSFVVAAINGISNLDKLAEEYKWLQAYEGTSFYLLLNEYLAVVILLILLAILPLVFDMISRNYECIKTESEIQNSIMSRYFYYQLANVYITVTAGTVFDSIQDIIDNPGSILSILGESLPNVSIYFANIIIVKTFTAVMFELVRAWPMICFYSVTLFTNKDKCTRRELRTGPFAAATMDYGWTYPSLLMIFMIIMIYCCISPILVCFSVVYFGFAYLMYKYQLLYVYINEYQSGGYMWYSVFNRSMLSLLCGVLTLLGYLGVRKAYNSGPFYIVIPLPGLIAYFWKRCNEKFRSPSMNLSLDSASEIDAINRRFHETGHKTATDTFTSVCYRQPSLIEKTLKPEPYRIDPSGDNNVNRLSKDASENSPIIKQYSSSADVENNAAAALRWSPTQEKFVLPDNVGSVESPDLVTIEEVIDAEELELNMNEILTSQFSNSRKSLLESAAKSSFKNGSKHPDYGSTTDRFLNSQL